MAEATERVDKMFGQANIKFTHIKSGKVLNFNGKEYLQAEGGEYTLTPSYYDEQWADSAENVVEKWLTGQEGAVKVVIGQYSPSLMQMALNAVQTITDTTSGDVVGFTDAPIGSKASDNAYKVEVHPRILPESDKSQDITFYRVIADSEFTRAFANEINQIEINFSMIPREGADFSKGGNYYFTGPQDPNAVTP
ncbi:hypothetical protein MKX72_20035 [Priestia sp. FSL R5-0597]|uniref:hypothetical protein n=1 Tax=Priestia sp. FSL R5-0597 TaxID=2921580 RepID=UPI0030F7BCD0